MKTYNEPSTLVMRLENKGSLCQDISPAEAPVGISISYGGGVATSE